MTKQQEQNTQLVYANQCGETALFLILLVLLLCFLKHTSFRRKKKKSLKWLRILAARDNLKRLVTALHSASMTWHLALRSVSRFGGSQDHRCSKVSLCLPGDSSKASLCFPGNSCSTASLCLPGDSSSTACLCLPGDSSSAASLCLPGHSSLTAKLRLPDVGKYSVFLFAECTAVEQCSFVCRVTSI